MRKPLPGGGGGGGGGAWLLQYMGNIGMCRELGYLCLPCALALFRFLECGAIFGFWL